MYAQCLLYVPHFLNAKCSIAGNSVAVSGDSSMEQSLKVTDSIITGCLQRAEALPGTTTSRQQLWLWLETRVKRKCRPARFPPDAPNITSLTAVLFTQTLYLLGVCLSLSFFHSDPWRKKTQLYDGTQWWLMGSAAGDSGQTEIGGFWHLGWVEACSPSPAVSFQLSVFKFCTRHHFSNEHLWTWVNSSVSSRVWILPVCHRTKRPVVTWWVSWFHLSWSDQIPLV